MTERNSGGGNLIVAIIIAVIVAVVVYFLIDAKPAGEVQNSPTTGASMSTSANSTSDMAPAVTVTGG